MGRTTLVNSTNLGITMALWLGTDTYDYMPSDAPQDNLPIISVTQLLKPTKALILAQQIPDGDVTVDLVKQAANRLGSSIHMAIEAAFENTNKDIILKSLGFSPQMAESLVVNPSDDFMAKHPEMIPVYLEKRAYRKIKTSAGTEVWISGKFDQVIGGEPEDNKSTKAYSYIKMDQSERGSYALQMAMYKWLSPKLITSDMGKINFIFTDWKAGEASRIDNYPPYPVMEMPVPLMNESDAEKFIRAKLDEIEKNAAFNQDDMIRCADDELWRGDDVHKYYSDPETAKRGGRATKNFETYAQAMTYKSEKNKGVVVTVPGEVKRCSYCDAAPVCKQRLEYVSE